MREADGGLTFARLGAPEGDGGFTERLRGPDLTFPLAAFTGFTVFFTALGAAFLVTFTGLRTVGFLEVFFAVFFCAMSVQHPSVSCFVIDTG
jgi:hypothetical protein